MGLYPHFLLYLKVVVLDMITIEFSYYLRVKFHSGSLEILLNAPAVSKISLGATNADVFLTVACLGGYKRQWKTRLRSHASLASFGLVMQSSSPTWARKIAWQVKRMSRKEAKATLASKQLETIRPWSLEGHSPYRVISGERTFTAPFKNARTLLHGRFHF